MGADIVNQAMSMGSMIQMAMESLVSPTITAVTTALFTAMFVGRKTEQKGLAGTKTTIFEEEIRTLLDNGRLSYREFNQIKNYLEVAEKADEFHKELRNIQLSQTVDYDMHMDIAAAVVTVHVGADQRLMPRKVGFYIFHADGLRLFTCQSTLVFVGRIEADEVVVRLDFVVILILVVLRIKHFALHIKKFRFTVYALQKNISTEYPVPVCIQQGSLQNFVMLIFQIVECSTIVCTFTRDVF